MFRLFPQPKQPEREAQSTSDNAEHLKRELRNIQLIDGAFVGPVSIGATPKSVRHTLKRQPKGWFVVDQQSPAVVFRTSWDKEQITLDASVPIAGVRIWLF